VSVLSGKTKPYDAVGNVLIREPPIFIVFCHLPFDDSPVEKIVRI
jgi:hypothetical protein